MDELGRAARLARRACSRATASISRPAPTSNGSRRCSAALGRGERARQPRHGRGRRPAQPPARADRRAGAGRLLRRRHRHRRRLRRGDRRRQRHLLDRRGALGADRGHHHSPAQRRHLRAPAAPLRADRRALRRRGGAAHRPRAPGGAARRLAAAGEEMVARLLENGPQAMAETKAIALQSAWGGFDARRRSTPWSTATPASA